MDYQTQQFRLLPYLASSYALVTTGVSMMMMFVQVMGQIDEGNLESLPEVRGQEDGCSSSLCPPLLLPSPSLPSSLPYSLPPSLSPLSLLPQLHATSAGLKAISAEISNEGIEVYSPQ